MNNLDIKLFFILVSLLGNNDIKDNNIEGFDEFWSLYPLKIAKVKARSIWKNKKCSIIRDILIKDVENRKKNDVSWKDGYIPHPTTYLSQERWNDQIKIERPKDGKTRSARKVHEDFYHDAVKDIFRKFD